MLLKGHIVVVNVQQEIRTGLECTAIRFVNSSNRRRQTKTLRNVNDVRSERNETTYKFLMCVKIFSNCVRLLLNICIVTVLTGKCDIFIHDVLLLTWLMTHVTWLNGFMTFDIDILFAFLKSNSKYNK